MSTEQMSSTPNETSYLHNNGMKGKVKGSTGCMCNLLTTKKEVKQIKKLEKAMPVAKTTTTYKGKRQLTCNKICIFII
jgi:hypothetical protein